ncbi:hypothetical protein PGT21_004160 [Puccinia graminis f. sp. tritici]|uniref:glutathione gamma-glutamylcysteinyltransferase n=1 Tax=Puccinia graminis f. sp. tritici TaxID=56615 RepID=A0A5B0PWU3_PUCGR|nr:hypothetical protein PGTUg99_020577 [Puccinia graminis f. sp. tritici]KAA1105362.1 hypothetical protein PGT21_004160 [Puccinia graminis f. sp. tritici]
MFQSILIRTTTKLKTKESIIFSSYSTSNYLPTDRPNLRLAKDIYHQHPISIKPTDKPQLLKDLRHNYPSAGQAHSSPMSDHQSNKLEAEKSNPARSFYQRQLPESCLSFTSDRGKALFRSALADGHLESFFPLASQLVTQHEPSFCGLATLCTVLNALGVDPKRVWKHPWRWFEQDMLDCCRPLESIRKNGITLAEFNCLARCNGLALTSRSPPIGPPEDDPIGYQKGLQEFRSHVATTTALSSAFLVVSFCRASLGQTGTGHFSPVAGYSAEEDRVLVLDVARFKYPSYWVGLEDLYKSMIPVDPASQRPRGYTILSYSPFLEKTNCLTCNPNPPSITRINLNKSSWAILSRELGPIIESVKLEPLPIAIRKIHDYISTGLAKIPNPIEIRSGLESEAQNLFSQISSSIHLLVDDKQTDETPPILIIFALAVLPSHPHALDLKFLEPELAYLRSQLNALGECCSLENDHEHPQEHRCQCKTS